ncbi:MAG: bifunctional adenosylcobinamide kinase/adenosylcobinamide-phosphate guanylyltransferase [Polyangiaceae bacterium]|nr:bifunctional adenosylcobinamide kinase/adenosylcobinamide-phosphate guanylyltransferase [Polyangiaceae bacterium]
MSRLLFIAGGARSGKSAFALARATALGPRRVFIATAQALDDEMRERIAHHRAERGNAFVTAEEPWDVPLAIDRLAGLDLDVAIVDCLTLWISNRLLRGDDAAQIAAGIDDLVAAAAAARFPVIVVSNEVGMGVVPEHPVGRAFRDITGRAHQRLAARADELYFAAMGCIVRLRPSPVALEGT